MIPSTTSRVPDNTADEVNWEIRKRTNARVAAYMNKSRSEINCRLRELDEEWDIERTLEANASTVSLIGLSLGFSRDKRWFILPTFVAAFLLQHAVQGWCPPLSILRRLGFRTATEINDERIALKVLRGDFEMIAVANSQNRHEHAVEAMMHVVRG